MNPERAERDWPPAVVAGAFQTGVLAVRTLARRGVRVACIDADPQLDGFRSVYGKTHLCPNPDTDPDAWIAFMIQLAGSMGAKPALISSADQFVSAIGKHADALRPHFILSPGLPLQVALADKDTQYAMAQEHGLPTPRTRVVRTSDDVRAVAADTRFPAVIKPFHFREWRTVPPDHPLFEQKVAIAQTAEELIRLWELAASINPHVVVQEVILGHDWYKRLYIGCYDREGRRIGHAMFQELRCNPVGTGNATVIAPVVDHEADAVCDQFFRAIGYSGVCELQLKRDSRTGRLELIEGNPRLSGGGTPAPFSGVDVCWLHYLDLIGVTVVPVSPNNHSFNHIVLRGEPRAIAANIAAGTLTWADIFRSYTPPIHFFDFDLRDWRVAARTIFRVTLSAGAAVARAIRGHRESEKTLAVVGSDRRPPRAHQAPLQ